MSTVNNGPQIVRNGLVLNLDAGNGKSYSTNRFQSLGSGTITENVTFAINGNGTFQRVAAGTVIGGYTVRPNDVVYSYALGVLGCHYHGNSAPIPAGSYATFSVDYLITGATNVATSYPNNVVLVHENYGGNALGGVTSLANNYQNIWQRLTLTNGPTTGVGTQAMFLYPGYCSPGKLADSGTIYFRNPKVEWTNVDTGNSTFSSTKDIGIWYDLSGNASNCTLTNGPTSNVSNKGNILFDGVNDYGSTGNVNLSNTNVVSVDMWVKVVNYRETALSANIVLELSSNFNSVATGFVVTFGDDSNPVFSSAYPIVLSVKGDVGYNINYWSKTLVNNLGWHHWCCIFDKSRAAPETFLYIDGISRTGNTTSYNSDNTNNFGNLPVYLGGRSTVANSNVQLSNVKIYNRALNATEILQNYEATKTRFGL